MSDLQITAGERTEGQAQLPPQPKTVRETGLELSLLAELVAKHLFSAGKTLLPVLTARLRLSINVLREVLDFMVAEQLAEVAWRGDTDIDVQYQLTSAGRQRTAAWLERSPYSGPAPVPLDEYRALLQRQSALLPPVAAQALTAEFADDCLPAQVRELVGAALHAHRSLLLHGPSGSGKTTLARRLGRLLQGTVGVPYAVAVGQEIMQVYDSAIHHPPPAQAPRPMGERRSIDSRWALCGRPVLHMGAELALDMLDLRHDPFSGSYQAPPQVKAAGGLVIVDDLGRQRIPAAELLNRFTQPLDTGVEQLALQGGRKFSVPFDVTMIFVTSLEPQAVLDPSSLRRLGYKVHVGPLGENAYRTLFRQECRTMGIVHDEVALRYLIEELHRGDGQPLLASFPRDILSRIADFAAFTGQSPAVSVATIDQAWSSMFATTGVQLAGIPDTNLFERIE
ncbi:ATP-binding protein [Pseudoduganella lutea]|uniref:ATP-binding protein n=1 Tax=Pseudoduganella lutea TaxID=321985 RepID=A0A4P6KWP5_9BURK|nr:ATP-binding protein [Pseudoduganella lutea]QBE63571.1 ATP-binding protein [Pseudoduganella lutea]